MTWNEEQTALSYAYIQGHLLRKEKGFTSSNCHKKGSNVTKEKAIITEADLVSVRSLILAMNDEHTNTNEGDGEKEFSTFKDYYSRP